MHVVTVFTVTCQVVREHHAMLSYYLLQKTVIYQQEAILNISNKTVLTSIQFACQPVLFIGSWDSPGGVMTR